MARVQDYDPEIYPELFARVDVTPDCILASVEVKGILDRDRTVLFSAISEAAANSRWANEAWLVFVDWRFSDRSLDEDVVSLARSVEVGLLEVKIEPNAPTLRVTIHYAAQTRATLRIGELTRARAGVLRSAQVLLGEWEPRGTFLDVDYADQKLRVLIQQALSNLRTQKGFTGGGAMADLLAPLRASAEDKAYVAGSLQASLRTAALSAGVEDGANLAPIVCEAGDSELTKRVADALSADMAEFGEVTLIPR